jgi:hypothetical protein
MYSCGHKKVNNMVYGLGDIETMLRRQNKAIKKIKLGLVSHTGNPS